jgi:hypothetical protein
MRRALLGISLIAVGGLGACQSRDQELGQPPAVVAADGQVAVVNAWCPIMTEAPMPGRVARPELTRTYNGMRVGFCCDDCPAAWDASTDAEKAGMFAAARAKPAKR